MHYLIQCYATFQVSEHTPELMDTPNYSKRRKIHIFSCHFTNLIISPVFILEKKVATAFETRLGLKKKDRENAIFIILSGVESSFWAPYTCLAFQQKHIQNPFKHLRWSVFACPVNDFKPLTVCAKTLHLRCLKRFWIRRRSDFI